MKTNIISIANINILLNLIIIVNKIKINYLIYKNNKSNIDNKKIIKMKEEVF